MKKLIENRRLLKNIQEKCKENYNKILLKRVFNGMTYKWGFEDMRILIMKKVLKAWKMNREQRAGKVNYYKEISENHRYKLVKTTFRKWRVYRVQCMRRRKQLEKAQNYYFKISFVKFLHKWRFLIQEKRRTKARLEKFYRNKLKLLSKQTFSYWVDYMKLTKTRQYAPYHYMKKLISTTFSSWINYVESSQRHAKNLQKAKKIYKMSLLKNSFSSIKQLKALKANKLTLSRKANRNFRKLFQKKTLKALSSYINTNKSDILKRKTITRSQSKFITLTFFNLWHKLFHKKLSQKSLARTFLASKNRQKSLQYLNEWVRKYNSHSSKRLKNSQKIMNFHMKWAKYKMVKYLKKWTKLYKSKENYRKMKKISRGYYTGKVFRRYFLGFSIVYEKAKIRKLKIYKALKGHEKALLVKSVRGMVKYFNMSIRKKIKFITAVKTWSANMYKRAWKCWVKGRERRKRKAEQEKAAWVMRNTELAQEGVKAMIAFGIQEKNTREEYIRALIINENTRTEKLMQKYGGKWLNLIKSKRASTFRPHTQPFISNSIDDFPTKTKANRKPPRRLPYQI